jgi:hypothetical protein
MKFRRDKEYLEYAEHVNRISIHAGEGFKARFDKNCAAYASYITNMIKKQDTDWMNRNAIMDILTKYYTLVDDEGARNTISAAGNMLESLA